MKKRRNVVRVNPRVLSICKSAVIFGCGGDGGTESADLPEMDMSVPDRMIGSPT